MFYSNLRRLVTQKSLDDFGGVPIQQQTIVEETGLTAKTVREWMRGGPLDGINASTIQAMVDYLGCEWTDLVTFRPEPIEEKTEEEKIGLPHQIITDFSTTPVMG